MEKEKSTRIYLRISEKDKQRIENLAKGCGLSVSEYMRKRALGYKPKTLPPAVFAVFHSKLCELLNKELSSKTEEAALKLFDDIRSELLDAEKEPADAIRKEMIEWQLQDFGP